MTDKAVEKELKDRAFIAYGAAGQTTVMVVKLSEAEQIIRSLLATQQRENVERLEKALNTLTLEVHGKRPDRAVMEYSQALLDQFKEKMRTALATLSNEGKE